MIITGIVGVVLIFLAYVYGFAQGFERCRGMCNALIDEKIEYCKQLLKQEEEGK